MNPVILVFGAMALFWASWFENKCKAGSLASAIYLSNAVALGFIALAVMFK